MKTESFEGARDSALEETKETIREFSKMEHGALDRIKGGHAGKLARLFVIMSALAGAACTEDAEKETETSHNRRTVSAERLEMREARAEARLGTIAIIAEKMGIPFDPKNYSYEETLEGATLNDVPVPPELSRLYREANAAPMKEKFKEPAKNQIEGTTSDKGSLNAY